MDGVLADMDGALLRQAETLFGADAVRSMSPVDAPPQAAETTRPQPVDANQPPSADPAEDPPPSTLKLTDRQTRKLWHHIATVENFWESLQEIEPGSVAKLAALAAEHRWETIFLTKRPPTAGATAQVQTQRWLESNGFRLPSVYVVQGSRGRIAAALALDIVVDDRPENCLDVISDSRARAVLVCRRNPESMAAAKRLGIALVTSVVGCLDDLASIETGSSAPGMMDRFRRLLRR
jgi:hypothetical protein